MRNFLRKIALSTTIALFCALIGLSAYFAAKNLKSIQGYAARGRDTSDLRSDITAVQLDLQGIETGQRGYLLTGDASYLTAYTQAMEKLPTDFSTLRSRLTGRPPAERAVETELEAVAGSKIAEVNETIRLREKGYRHRSFLIVNSNRGKELMDEAQSLLAQMSAIEGRNLEQHKGELANSIVTAREQSALASALLLVLTVITLVAFHRASKGVEVSYRRQSEEVRATRQKLEQLTSTISESVLTTAAQMRSHAETLLNVHGGFLPHQGQERAQWIHEGSCHIYRVLDSLLEHPRAGTALEDANAGRPYPVEATEQTEPRRQTA